MLTAPTVRNPPVSINRPPAGTATTTATIDVAFAQPSMRA